MAFNGSGTFVRLYNWVTDKTNGVDITASRMDGEDNGFAAGLSNCVTRDGQGPPTADFLPNADNTLNLGSLSKRWATINGVAVSALTSIKAAKVGSTTRSSTTTLANDPELVITIPAAGTYALDAYIVYGGTVTGAQGLQWNFNYTGTAFAYNSYLLSDQRTYPPITQNIVASPTSGLPNQYGNLAVTPSFQSFFVRGLLVANAGATTLGFAWAQLSSNTNPTAILQGSYMLVTRLL